MDEQGRRMGRWGARLMWLSVLLVVVAVVGTPSTAGLSLLVVAPAVVLFPAGWQMWAVRYGGSA
ncbi:hypothetical protein [Kineococcus sp. NUM-3379]